MSEHIVLVDGPAPWLTGVTGLEVVSVRHYLTGPTWAEPRDLQVVNLCRDLQYHSPGYYASLLAEARGHRVIPTVRTIQDLSQRILHAPELEEIGQDLHKVLTRRGIVPEGDRAELVLLVGESPVPELRELARALFEAFRVPILRVELRRREGWQLAGVRAAGLRAVPQAHRDAFREALTHYLGRRWRQPRGRRVARYEVAILHDPDEVLPPSNRRALANFIRAARRLEMGAELVTRRDLARLGEFDALFIRETTGVDHYTYRFARRAAADGLVVVDDPDSILRCTNKIFLAERLARANVATPRSVVVARDEVDRAADELGFPLVLKVPDGSFSRGVFKVADGDELEARAALLFRSSELLLAQAYTYTPFDWRIGVLAGEPLYACRYHMSRGHWQILDHRAGSGPREGHTETLAVEAAPGDVVRTAVRAARLMGDGLYGVDLKETDRGVLVIEVNDNPNIDAGFEDAILGDVLYDRVMGVFAARLEDRTRRRNSPASRHAPDGDLSR